jgi:hypothetical protein
MTQQILVQGHYKDVPERGAIIVDPDTKSVKIGDGSTPGGLSVAGGIGTDPTFTSVTTSDLTVTGQKITLTTASDTPANNDQLGTIEFKGNTSSGALIRYGSIYSQIKDTTHGEDDSALWFVARKEGQHKPFVIMSYDGIFFFNDLPLVLKSADGKTTRIKGASTTKRNINFPDSNGEVMVNDNGKVMATDLPTSDPSNEGQLWNDNGTVKISAG